MRIYGLARVAEARGAMDKDKAATLLVAAFEQTKALPMAEERVILQAGIIRKLVNYSPSRAEELWMFADPEVQESSTTFLVLRRLNDRDFGGAVDFALRAPAEKQFPYGTLLMLMDRLPPEMDAERQQIVMKSLLYLRAHPPKMQPIAAPDMARVLQQYWRQLPRALVLEAIDLLLLQSRQATDKGYASTVILRTEKKALSFTSGHELRAFQLLPILTELDPARAQSLLDSTPGIQAYVREFPRGIAMPGDNKSEAPSGRITSASYSSGTQPLVAGIIERERANNAAIEAARQVQELAETDPAAALRGAAAVPESSRASALQAVIMAAQRRKMPEVSGPALDQMLQLVANSDLSRRGMGIDFLFMRAVGSGDVERFQKVIDLAARTAAEYYKQDTDSEDPNQVSKALWPSTSLWAAAAFHQSRVDPSGVTTILNAIDDPDIRSFARLTASLGAVWGGPVRSLGTVRRKKFTATYGPPF